MPVVEDLRVYFVRLCLCLPVLYALQSAARSAFLRSDTSGRIWWTLETTVAAVCIYYLVILGEACATTTTKKKKGEELEKAAARNFKGPEQLANEHIYHSLISSQARKHCTSFIAEEHYYHTSWLYRIRKSSENSPQWNLHCYLHTDFICIAMAPFLQGKKYNRTNSDINQALNLWAHDEERAEKRYGHIRDWNTHSVTSMANLFKNKTHFNQDISRWDVCNVISTECMFSGASSFKQDLSRWNLTVAVKGKRVHDMFKNAPLMTDALQPHQVAEMKCRSDQDIFGAVNMWCSNKEEAELSYGHISQWNVSRVTNMRGLFRGMTKFCDNIEKWDVSNVTDMSYMFEDAQQCRSALTEWDVSNVRSMDGMFRNASRISLNIANWNVRNVAHCDDMFEGTSNRYDREFKLIPRKLLLGSS